MWTVVTYDNLQACVKDFSATVSPRTFNSSTLYCNVYSAHILRINSTAISTIIKSLLLKNDLFYWLDATDASVEGLYVWNSYSGSPGSVIDSTIIPWCTNQPDGSTTENCLALSPMNWCLVDIACSSALLYFVCQTTN